MNPRNGRKPASIQTEIKHYVNEALWRSGEGIAGKDGVVKFVTVAFASSLGTVDVRLVAQSPFQNSHYRVTHPEYGTWTGYLNGNQRNGEYGVSPGRPTQTPAQ